MRIAFLGKGGSGKTTLCASFIHYLSRQNPHILAIDADVNVHLADALGMTSGIRIGNSFKQVSEYFRGQRTDLNGTPMVATTPPSLRSTFIRPQAHDPFLQTYASQQGAISLVTVGTYTTHDVGHSCYHGKLNSLESMYHHLLDTEQDWVVADTTAGIDNLGTSLFFTYDINIFVVEPTQKSIRVYQEFLETSKDFSLKIKVIANKIQSEADREFIQKHISEDQLLGFVPWSAEIAAFEQGTVSSLELAALQQSALFEALIAYVKSCKKDWDRYYDLLLRMHKKNSIEWWNDFRHLPIDKQLDPDFNYHKVL